MSYSFDGSNDRMTGSLTSTYADPVTIACFIKVTDHPLAADVFVEFGNSATSHSDSYSIRSQGTDNVWSAMSATAAAAESVATKTKVIDNVWTGIVGKFSSDTLRDIYVGALADTGQNTTSRVLGDALQHIQIGENLANGNDFVGKIAEVAIWNSALSDADITSYLAGTVATSISAANLIAYYPLSASNATQVNDGVDAGGDLAVTGATFDADHPTITSGLTPIRMIWRL